MSLFRIELCRHWQGSICLLILCTSLICNARLAPWNVVEETLAEAQLPEVVNQMCSLQQDKFILKLWERVASGASDFDFGPI